LALSAVPPKEWRDHDGDEDPTLPVALPDDRNHTVVKIDGAVH
jgi:hypothetical protein